MTSVAAMWVLIRRRQATPKRLLTLAVSTVFAAQLVVLTYTWWFDASDCSSRLAISCVLNQNPGMISSIALLTALSGFWVSYAVDRDATKRQHIDDLEKSYALLALTLDEAHHNLLHAALATRDHEIEGWPQFSIIYATEVCHSSQWPLVPEEYLHRCQIILREYEYYMEAKRNLSSVNRSGQVPEFRNQSESQQARSHTNSIDPFVMQAVLLILHGAIYDPRIRVAVNKLENSELSKFADDTRRADEAALANGQNPAGYLYFFRSSDAASDLPEIRMSRSKLICWTIDEVLPETDIFEMGRSFSDR
ncbi:MAG: hypothetical protein AAB327_07165, partial [Actinomycetota bacterium]